MRPNKSEDGKFSIYARVVVNGTHTEVSIKALVFPDNWTTGKGAAKARSEDLKELNNCLEEVRGKLFTHYRDLKIDEEELTAEAVKNSYLGVTDEKEEILKTLLWLAVQFEHGKSAETG